ncbi:MAG: 3'-5' exonuclease [Bacteroidales bacterium]|nr:3'-5' exonuclease [Bacteroidales bacterium]
MSSILFLDIETVPIVPLYEELDDDLQKMWDRKSGYFRKEDQTAEDAFERAGIYAEFGKIICISVGVIHYKGNEMHFRLKSFAGEDEKELLTEFNEMLDKRYSGKDNYLCAHNGKEFDFPYIARRSIINGVPLPVPLQIAGKKPWEILHLDTMELWKFGDYKSFTSLALLSKILNIPSPKDDIDGSEVAHVFYVDNDLPRIVKYCEKDVLTVAQIFMRFRGLPLILAENISRAE